MKLIDSHTHISSQAFEDDRMEVLSRALDICSHLIDIGAGTAPDSHWRAKNFAEQIPEVYFTAGIHPHDAASLGSQNQIRKEIESLLPHPKCVAVGEAGLDYYYNHSPKEAQAEVFRWQIDLAEKTGLPLMIHTREAEKDTMDLLSSFKGGAVFHCFTSSQELADFGVERGFFISFSGIVTFKNAEELRQIFLKTPLENILIETDAPYLAPVPLRGKRNESSFIQHTAKFLAQLRGMGLEDFIRITRENSLRCFKKLRSPSQINPD